MDSALKDFIDYVDTNNPTYGDTELLYLSFRLLIEDKNEAINSLEFYPDKNGYERVRVTGIGKHKVFLEENAINEEKELDGTENGILYCESIEEGKPKKKYYYLLGSPWPFELGKLSIIDTAIDRSRELLPSRLKSRRHSMGGGKRRNSKRKSKKIKTKRKTYKRKNKRSKIKKSRRSFIKKTRTNKSRANKSRAKKSRKRMVGGLNDMQKLNLRYVESGLATDPLVPFADPPEGEKITELILALGHLLDNHHRDKAIRIMMTCDYDIKKSVSLALTYKLFWDRWLDIDSHGDPPTTQADLENAEALLKHSNMDIEKAVKIHKLMELDKNIDTEGASTLLTISNGDIGEAHEMSVEFGDLYSD
jgi:hypothetical protein